jgi:hypothetical protein
MADNESKLSDAIDRATEKAARLRASHDRLLAELENIVPRFHRCCIATGSAEWAADGAVENARAAIAAAKEV